MPQMATLAAGGLALRGSGARVIAAELEATGFSVALSPIVDLCQPQSFIAERCLAADPFEVARLAAAFVEELSKRGIMTCAKHFPGLGGATSDPHFSLPRIERTKRKLLQEEAVHFVILIRQNDMF